MDELIREGALVITDGRMEQGRCWASLAVCDDWDGAAFRIESGPLDVMLAVDVEITGRSIRTIGATWGQGVRVKVTFRGDGDEPDHVASGWVAVS